MKRSVIVLVLAILVFITTLFISNRYMSRVTEREADSINHIIINESKIRMDLNLAIRENAVHSFLSALFFYDITPKGDKRDTLITVDNREIKRLYNEMYDNLNDFIKLHPRILSASFLIDPAIYPEKGAKGYAPTVMADGSRFDLADSCNYVKLPNYIKAKESKNCLWTLPPDSSPIYSNTILYCAPIFRSSGEFFGVFAISVTLDSLRSQMRIASPYSEHKSSAILVDENNIIILSTKTDHETYTNLDEFVNKLKASDKQFHEVEHSTPNNHTIVSWKDQNYYVYENRLTYAPWTIVTICPETYIYQKVWHTHKIILAVSLVGMLLMLICCGVVFREIRKQILQKAAAEEEIKMAAAVQKSLLKPSLFTIDQLPAPVTLNAFIRPAREAGGDLYDYTEKDGKLIFCIGDVSGKGMPAALFMTQVVSLFRNAVRYTSDPTEIVTQMNNVLASDNPKMTFCTFFLGVLSGEELSYCNAGHNSPILYAKKTEQPQPSYLESYLPNVALGLMEDYPYRSETISFKHGDKLILYTDGVTEAMNRNGDQFGEKRLLSVVSSSSVDVDTNNLITDSIAQFVQDAEQSDDITIVSVSC